MISNESHKLFWEQMQKFTKEDIPRLMGREKDSRNKRIIKAFQEGAQTDFSGIDRQLFDRMWLERICQKSTLLWSATLAETWKLLKHERQEKKYPLPTISTI
jgi:hypothetical protein